MLMSIKESHRPEPGRFNSQEHGGIEMAESPSLRSPEVVAGPSPMWEQCSLLNETQTAYTGGVDSKMREHDHHATNSGAIALDTYPPSYINSETKYYNAEAQPMLKKWRYCGLRKAWCISLAVVAALFVIGAVLGGVLGTHLVRNRSAPNEAESAQEDLPNSPKAIADTGLAAAVSTDSTGRLLVYYKNVDNRITERSFLDRAWIPIDANAANASVVTEMATPGSPLAAITFTNNGVPYRQVFYVDGLGQVQTTNSITTADPGDAEWSPPVLVSGGDEISASSPALAACGQGDDDPNVRVYYGADRDGSGILERIGPFDGSVDDWVDGGFFEAGNPNSGVACVLSGEYLSVYMQEDDGAVHQHWQLAAGEQDWGVGPNISADWIGREGARIAACGDGARNDFVFFQNQAGAIMRAKTRADFSDALFENYTVMQTGIDKTALMATFFANGALYGVQDSSANDSLALFDVSREGRTTFNTSLA